MISEIAWLMEAFLEEDPKKLRVMIKNRMAVVTENLTAIAPASVQAMRNIPPDIMNQAPSTQRILASNPDLIPKVAPPVTQAAAQALAARQALIMSAGKEKPEAGRTSPRKA